jgi:predicted PurR-regulated permease PerM
MLVRRVVTPPGESALQTRTENSANQWLKQIVFLLWILALALILAFCYFASSVCITVLLACFLAILVDPLIMFFERLHVSRTFSAAVVMAVGMLLTAALSYYSYRQISDVVDDMPVYAQRIDHAVAPIAKKIKRVQDTAGKIGSELPTKKVPEVKISSTYPDWTGYVVRGVGPVSGAIIIIGVVPFLMFFLLVQKRRIKEKFAIVMGENLDVSQIATNVTEMIRGFVLGNLIVGLLMAAVTAAVLFTLKIDNAIMLGLLSGLLNVLPFIGAILGTLIPGGAVLIQDRPLGTLVIIMLTVVALHTVCLNFLVPKIIGRRVSISPVAATIGIMFWGWLWGLIGVLLAIPLTALVRIVADAHPSLSKLADVLAERPAKVPPWSRAERSVSVAPEPVAASEPSPSGPRAQARGKAQECPE